MSDPSAPLSWRQDKIRCIKTRGLIQRKRELHFHGKHQTSPPLTTGLLITLSLIYGTRKDSNLTCRSWESLTHGKRNLHFTSLKQNLFLQQPLRPLLGNQRRWRNLWSDPPPAFWRYARQDYTASGRYSRRRDPHRVQVGQPHHVGVADEPWLQRQLSLDSGLQLRGFPGLLNGIVHEGRCLGGLDRVADGETFRLGRRRNFGLSAEKEFLLRVCPSTPRQQLKRGPRDLPGASCRYLWCWRTDETQLLFPLFDLPGGCLHHLFDLRKENQTVSLPSLGQQESRGPQHPSTAANVRKPA